MTAQKSSQKVLTRWLKFNAVGGIGIGVQLLAIAVFKSVLHFNYLLATALAVEVTIVHNFIWHERFTWSDRQTDDGMGLQGVAVRLLKFNLTTGTFSILGNLAAMKMFVSLLHINYFLANCMAIAACSLINFAVADRFVFREISAKQTCYSECP